MRPLEDPNDIRAAYDEMANILKRCARPLPRNVGHPDGNSDREVYWLPDHRFWCVLDPDKMDNSYQCLMGTADAPATEKLSINSEINIGKRAGRSIAGVFVRDESNQTILTHSGRITITGCKYKIDEVLRWHGNVELMHWRNGKSSDAIVVSHLNDDLPAKLAAFVRRMEQFKAMVRAREVGDG